MTVTETLQQAGIALNAPVQQVAGNPNVPASVANVASLMGNSVQFAMGPTAYYVFIVVGADPNVPGT